MEQSQQPEAINPSNIDWALVQRSAFLVHQNFRYEYPAPIRDLRQRLVVIPPANFGNQRRTLHRVEVSEPGEITTSLDAFGNTIVEVRIPSVDGVIEFEAWVEVERAGPAHPRRLTRSWLQDARLLLPTLLTSPDDVIQRAADELAGEGAQGLALAELANTWVHRALVYRYGITGVKTTAAEALAGGYGVCQDFAHVMIALCRLLGLPTLYVSGHLLGEGGTHAWVEVLLPAEDGSGLMEAWAFDPTHGRHAGPTYVTVAIGRDYADVAPTSGSYRARHSGTLSVRKQVRLTEIAYDD